MVAADISSKYATDDLKAENFYYLNNELGKMRKKWCALTSLGASIGDVIGGGCGDSCEERRKQLLIDGRVKECEQMERGGSDRTI